MPNRILKEGVCTSDQINELTWFEEALFYRMIVNCDDFGRFDGRIQVVKNRLFPLKENITAKQVKDGINKLESVGLIVLYEYDGKPFLHLPTWNDHQSVRAKRSKYPAPEDGVQSHEISCNQMHADEGKCSRNPIQSNPNPNTNASKTQKNTRHKYGHYENVLLSDEEYQKLQDEFPNDYLDRIERLSEYIASTGKKYSSHLATIRSWARNDGGQNMSKSKRKGVPMGASGELGAAELSAIAQIMGDKEGAVKWAEEDRRGG